jgi:hypothetical protein
MLPNPSAVFLRLGIVLGDLGKANIPALQFLAVKLNSLQDRFQFEFLSPPGQAALSSEDSQNQILEFLQLLKKDAMVDREEVRKMTKAFAGHFITWLQNQQASEELQERNVPDRFVVITLASFSDGYYSMRSHPVSVLALGSWRRHMSPPSLLEFILTLLVREAVALSCPSLRKSVHLGARGCLMDFNPSLDQVRIKVLAGLVCQDCRSAMKRDGQEGLAEVVEKMVSRAWIGKSEDGASPAGIISRLGYDLFVTKGLHAKPWETIKRSLQEESVKELIKLAFAVAAAAILLRLGLKQ